MYPMDNVEMARYICEGGEDQVAQMIESVNEFHYRAREEFGLDQKWYDVL